MTALRFRVSGSTVIRPPKQLTNSPKYGSETGAQRALENPSFAPSADHAGAAPRASFTSPEPSTSTTSITDSREPPMVVSATKAIFSVRTGGTQRISKRTGVTARGDTPTLTGLSPTTLQLFPRKRSPTAYRPDAGPSTNAVL